MSTFRNRALFQFALTLGACLFSPVFATSAVAQDDAPPAMREPLREERSVRLPAGRAIEVDNRYGSVFVRFGGYEHQFDLQVTRQQPDGAPAVDVAAGMRDGVYAVSVRLPAGAALADGQRVDLVLYVPEAHPLRVSTSFGGIESRGAKSDLDLRSESGDISVRGTAGRLQLHSDDGNLQASIEGAARAGEQRLSTRTGNISLGVSDALNADVRMSSSGLLTTDYSLDIAHRDGEEPNKIGRLTVGTPAVGAQAASISLESLAGAIQLLRRAVYVDAP